MSNKNYMILPCFVTISKVPKSNNNNSYETLRKIAVLVSTVVLIALHQDAR